MAKKKGGVGRHVTKNVSRLFVPNLHEHRIWVPELKKFVRVRVTARGLKTINKNGAYKSLKKAGAIIRDRIGVNCANFCFFCCEASADGCLQPGSAVDTAAATTFRFPGASTDSIRRAAADCAFASFPLSAAGTFATIAPSAFCSGVAASRTFLRTGTSSRSGRPSLNSMRNLR